MAKTRPLSCDRTPPRNADYWESWFTIYNRLIAQLKARPSVAP